MTSLVARWKLASYLFSRTSVSKELPAVQETRVWFLDQKDPLEKEMASHSSILAWKSYGQRSLVGYSPWGHKESDTTERLHFPFLFLIGLAGKESACNAGDLGLIPGLGRSPGEGKGYPLQYSGLGNSMDCIVHGVTKSQTWLSDFHFKVFLRITLFLLLFDLLHRQIFSKILT